MPLESNAVVRLNPQLRRAYILEAGRALVQSKGFGAVGCQAVADACEVRTSVETVKHIFRNKTLLAEAIAEHAQRHGYRSIVREAKRLGILK